MIFRMRSAAPLIPVLFLLVTACQEREAQQTQQTQQAEPARQAEPQAPEAAGTTDRAGEPQEAMAHLQPTEGNNVNGQITFTRTPDGIEVVAELQGLSPGKHGIHVHEKGDCSAPDASSAGEHFNPEGAPHGAPDNPPAQRHVGDLGNIEAGADGSGSYRRVDQVITLDGPQAIVGKAVVVHAGADDLTSQPSGDSGDRVACGVIELKTR